MSVNKDTTYGKISIASKAIASVVANAALECYGVVGLASKGGLRDKIESILSKDEYVKGVSVSQVKSSVTISLYLVIASGVKVTEVLNEVQKKVRYVTSSTFEIKVNKVNVYAVSLRKIN
jgi:uncharacterized alkaline shock family protein YloU